MYGWKAAGENCTSGSSKYLKVPIGEQVRCIFLGEPFTKFVWWNDTDKKYQPWNDQARGDKVARVAINVMCNKDGTWSHKILEMAPILFSQVKKLCEVHGQDKKIIVVSRVDKKTYVAYPEADITPAWRAKLAGLDLFNLDDSEKVAPPTESFLPDEPDQMIEAPIPDDACPF